MWGSLVLCLCFFAFPAKAQSETAASAKVESLSPAQAEQARLRAIIDGAPAAYEDNFMSADDLKALRAGEPEEVDPSTLPLGLRNWVLESRLGVAQSDAGERGRQSGTELGQRIQYRQQTLNYGDWLLQADVRSMQGARDSFNGIGSLG
ncbi:MAG: hypothetical protein LBI76_15115, partial [Comamonas sp.]|nr:hypothetical protein [Comamonas sp.]